MSAEDKKSQQSSRLLYKTPGTRVIKDHKAIYYKDTTTAGYEGFHYMMYMKDKDPSVQDILWRKMWPDRYFSYVSTGVYDWNGFYSIVYPEQNVKSNTRQVFYQGTVYHTGDYVIFQSGSDVFTAREDGRVFLKLKNFDYVYRSSTSAIGVSYLQRIMCGCKGGFIWEERENIASSTTLFTYYFVKIDENFTVTSKEEIFSRNSGISKFIGDPRSVFVLYRSTTSQSWGFINTLTGEVFPEFAVVSSNSGSLPVHILGYWYITGYYTPDSSRPYEHCPAIQRISENGVQEFKFLRDYIGYDYFWSSSIIYNEGTFYWYMQPTNNSALMLMTASDIVGNWTQINLPDTITFHRITGSGNFTYRLKPSYTGSYDADYILYQNCFSPGGDNALYKYEENKRVFDTDWLIANVYRYAPNSNNLICYFDNLLFEPSDNNKFCYNSDITPYGDMWDKYGYYDTVEEG